MSDDSADARGCSTSKGSTPQSSTPRRREPQLPPLRGSMAHSHARGEVFRVEGTNVLRVPFGVRQARRARPERPDRWVTLVLPFQASPTPTPPQAA
ncbi:hypothetical protein KQ302_03530 [Synechococcus sp. CS-602]|nr:hypothetical protein [Synechococcus sp. CS-603]MCT0204190.1 hypothetical protein [Synechococcus sp. CS-602]MCT0247317.1 hypothetical protein [Synechococcus sp. CS-601]